MHINKISWVRFFFLPKLIPCFVLTVTDNEGSMCHVLQWRFDVFFLFWIIPLCAFEVNSAAACCLFFNISKALFSVPIFSHLALSKPWQTLTFHVFKEHEGFPAAPVCFEEVRQKMANHIPVASLLENLMLVYCSCYFQWTIKASKNLDNRFINLY